MTAIATMINPLIQDKVVIFWNKADGSLGMSIRLITDDQEAEFASTSTTAAKDGLIKNPSSIATFIQDGLVNVYGVGYDNYVYRVSPVIEPLGDANIGSNFACLAGTSLITERGQEICYLYYLDGKSNQPTEYVVGTGPNKTLEDCCSAKSTYIAATTNHDLAQRWVIYQLHDNTIQLYDPVSKLNFLITDSQQAKAQTPLGLCYVSDGTEHRTGRIFVYYTNIQGELLRSVKRVGPNDDAQFSSPYNFGDKANAISQSSQISVTTGPRSNFVFYITGEAENTKLVKFNDPRV